MHTSAYNGDGWWVDFHHNGDYSEVIIVLPPESGRIDNNTLNVMVPFQALEQLVLDKLRSELISKLEQAEGEELKALLGLTREGER